MTLQHRIKAESKKLSCVENISRDFERVKFSLIHSLMLENRREVNRGRRRTANKNQRFTKTFNHAFRSGHYTDINK